ncbi:uncharacterized protein LOC129599948 [Paramacrobiotus metropolitanus]|uniref:uncharacterized protein LOC129599948 n=1 Tax=Paramacrobiotus metropolitanus TaxID=2943436 RepID=UPI0024457EF2|nr:uncharacterized protein LOC129599948 [Paramacrobiotus metropolitanus]
MNNQNPTLFPTRQATPEVRVSFTISRNSLRTHQTEENLPDEKGILRRFRICTHETNLIVPSQEGYKEIPAGLWKFSIHECAIREIGSKVYHGKETNVSLILCATPLEERQIKSPGFSDFLLDFFMSGSDAGKIMKGSATLNNQTFQCTPIKIPHIGYFSHKDALPTDAWNLEMVFHIGSLAKNTMSKQLGNILRSATFTDCTLVSADERSFPAHRVILAAQSPVFAAMFSHDTLEKTSGVCTIADVRGEILDIVLDFLYRHIVFEGIKNNAEEVLAAADKYDLDDLRSVCEDLLTAELRQENAARFLRIAVNYGLDKLLKKAARIVSAE